jgi:hypothetical protein
VQPLIATLYRYQHAPHTHTRMCTYTCTHHRYSERALLTVAELFGCAIDAHLISTLSTPAALRLVLEALRMAPGTDAARYLLTLLLRFSDQHLAGPDRCL